MRKALFTIICLFAVMASGLGLKAQEITITLNPGWTWIGYTNAEAMSISAALGDFVPMSGDMIKSKGAGVTYLNGRWLGGFQQFIPGCGYHYYSNRTEPVSFVFAGTTPQVTVTTSEPTDVTATSAVVVGTVGAPEGTHVFLRGVCWGTEPTPDIDGNHTSDSALAGGFSDTLVDLSPNTIYYVRAYVVTDHGLFYGNEVSFTSMCGIPVVSTAEVIDITATTATCGGTVTDGGGLDITARGVCWSISHNPTLSDSHTADGTGTGSFTSSLTGLSASTTYYVCAYASNSYVTIYGNEVSFTTLGGGSGNDHEYVDLGLPSGTLWATCNVGANTPEEYGDYFAWGETQPKNYYEWSTYQYCMGSDHTLTKYCTKSSFGYNGFTDNLTTLLPEDDAATANWGNNWRMPTKTEWRELYIRTTVTWTTRNGVNGYLFTASNGNSLFLPATGCRYVGTLFYAGSQAYYWSSSLYTDPNDAWHFSFDSGTGTYGIFTEVRNWGQTVRAVRSSAQN